MIRSVFAVMVVCLVSACASHSVQDAFQGQQDNTGLVTSANTVLIKYVDNDEVKEGFIGQEITYRVDAGQRTLLLEYSDLFNIGSDEHEKIVSRPAKVSFQVKPGEHYKVTNPPQKSLAAAKTFAEKPDFRVMVVETGEEVASSVELSRPRTFLTQLKSAVTPVYEFESDQVQGNPSDVALNQLKTIWTHATDAEREAFKEWLEGQQ